MKYWKIQYDYGALSSIDMQYVVVAAPTLQEAQDFISDQWCNATFYHCDEFILNSEKIEFVVGPMDE